VHVYPDGNVMTTNDFDTNFGNQSAQLPVVITEFAAWGTPVPPVGQDPGLGLAGQPISQLITFINYLNTHKIGLSASAFDVPGIMVLAVAAQGEIPPPNAWDKTYFNCYTAGSSVRVHPDPNVGTLVYNFFSHNYDNTIYTTQDSYASGVSCQ